MENLHTKERLEYLEKLGFVIHTSDNRLTKLHSHSFLEFTYIESGMILLATVILNFLTRCLRIRLG